MAYRIVFTNKQNGNVRLSSGTFSSVQKAKSFADKWEEDSPYETCMVYKSDLKTRVY